MPTMDDVRAVAALMRGFTHPWWIAGGFALDLFAGRNWRKHSDLEIGLLRVDQTAIRAHFPGWKWLKVVQREDKGQWIEWNEGEQLILPIFQVKPIPPTGTFAAEFFLDESTDGVWRFRRNGSIRRPVDEIASRSHEGIPYLLPEIQLLYKARKRRQKDELDFATVVPMLSSAQRTWLKHALQTWDSTDPWISRL